MRDDKRASYVNSRAGSWNLRSLGLAQVRTVAPHGRAGWSRVSHVPTKGEVAPQDAFHTILALEHRRAARAGARFVLMLLDFRKANGSGRALSGEMTSILADAIRETDLIGWYEHGLVLGVLFTELPATSDNSVADILCSRVLKALREKLHRSLATDVVITLRALPESSENGSDSVMTVALHANIPQHQVRKYPDVQTAADPA